MNKYKKEFLRLREAIENEDIANIRLYLNKDSFATYASVQAYTYPAEGLIVLKKSKKLTWLDLCHCILHEYGHCLDYKRNKNSKRWKLAEEYDCYNDKTIVHAPTIPNKAKVAILKTEYIADQWSKKLAKKYTIKFPKNYIEIEQIINIKIRKYEMIHGCSCPITRRDIWKKALKTHFFPLPENYMKDFTYL